ncbi:unnamed protein product [Amoebophrya sp. A120]|nr:unnamed protein product [Amoebophrya sp. A120]|eukprot:GSA120T00021250001.1
MSTSMDNSDRPAPPSADEVPGHDQELPNSRVTSTSSQQTTPAPRRSFEGTPDLIILKRVPLTNEREILYGYVTEDGTEKVFEDLARRVVAAYDNPTFATDENHRRELIRSWIPNHQTSRQYHFKTVETDDHVVGPTMGVVWEQMAATNQQRACFVRGTDFGQPSHFIPDADFQFVYAESLQLRLEKAARERRKLRLVDERNSSFSHSTFISSSSSSTAANKEYPETMFTNLADTLEGGFSALDCVLPTVDGGILLQVLFDVFAGCESRQRFAAKYRSAEGAGARPGDNFSISLSESQSSLLARHKLNSDMYMGGSCAPASPTEPASSNISYEKLPEKKKFELRMELLLHEFITVQQELLKAQLPFPEVSAEPHGSSSTSSSQPPDTVVKNGPAQQEPAGASSHQHTMNEVGLQALLRERMRNRFLYFVNVWNIETIDRRLFLTKMEELDQGAADAFSHEEKKRIFSQLLAECKSVGPERKILLKQMLKRELKACEDAIEEKHPRHTERNRKVYQQHLLDFDKVDGGALRKFLGCGASSAPQKSRFQSMRGQDAELLHLLQNGIDNPAGRDADENPTGATTNGATTMQPSTLSNTAADWLVPGRQWRGEIHMPGQYGQQQAMRHAHDYFFSVQDFPFYTSHERGNFYAIHADENDCQFVRVYVGKENIPRKLLEIFENNEEHEEKKKKKNQANSPGAGGENKTASHDPATQLPEAGSSSTSASSSAELNTTASSKDLVENSSSSFNSFIEAARTIINGGATTVRNQGNKIKVVYHDRETYCFGYLDLNTGRIEGDVRQLQSNNFDSLLWERSENTKSYFFCEPLPTPGRPLLVLRNRVVTKILDTWMRGHAGVADTALQDGAIVKTILKNAAQSPALEDVPYLMYDGEDGRTVLQQGPPCLGDLPGLAESARKHEENGGDKNTVGPPSYLLAHLHYFWQDCWKMQGTTRKQAGAPREDLRKVLQTSLLPAERESIERDNLHFLAKAVIPHSLRGTLRDDVAVGFSNMQIVYTKADGTGSRMEAAVATFQHRLDSSVYCEPVGITNFHSVCPEFPHNLKRLVPWGLVHALAIQQVRALQCEFCQEMSQLSKLQFDNEEAKLNLFDITMHQSNSAERRQMGLLEVLHGAREGRTVCWQTDPEDTYQPQPVEKSFAILKHDGHLRWDAAKNSVFRAIKSKVDLVQKNMESLVSTDSDHSAESKNTEGAPQATETPQHHWRIVAESCVPLLGQQCADGYKLTPEGGVVYGPPVHPRRELCRSVQRQDSSQNKKRIETLPLAELFERRTLDFVPYFAAAESKNKPQWLLPSDLKRLLRKAEDRTRGIVTATNRTGLIELSDEEVVVEDSDSSAEDETENNALLADTDSGPLSDDLENTGVKQIESSIKELERDNQSASDAAITSRRFSTPTGDEEGQIHSSSSSSSAGQTRGAALLQQSGRLENADEPSADRNADTTKDVAQQGHSLTAAGERLRQWILSILPMSVQYRLSILEKRIRGTATWANTHVLSATGIDVVGVYAGWMDTVPVVVAGLYTAIREGLLGRKSHGAPLLASQFGTTPGTSSPSAAAEIKKQELDVASTPETTSSSASHSTPSIPALASSTPRKPDTAEVRKADAEDNTIDLTGKQEMQQRDFNGTKLKRKPPSLTPAQKRGRARGYDLSDAYTHAGADSDLMRCSVVTPLPDKEKLGITVQYQQKAQQHMDCFSNEFHRTAAVFQDWERAIKACAKRVPVGVLQKWRVTAADFPDGVEDDLCVICMGKMEVSGVIHPTTATSAEEQRKLDDANAVIRLPRCKHMLHLACAQTWLNEHSHCPTCRTEVMEEEISSGPPPRPAGEPAV